MSQHLLTVDELFELVDQCAGSSRLIVGLVGSPGSGKSTLAADLARRLGDRSVVVGMDGFHLSSGILVDLDLSNVKGAPDTFDAAGFVALLRRLRDQESLQPIYAPAYDRAHGEPIAGSVVITSDHKIVIVDGNYLLMDGPWREVRGLLDISVFLRINAELRLERLIARHISFGRTATQANEWVHRSDEANARQIDSTVDRADYLVDIV